MALYERVKSSNIKIYVLPVSPTKNLHNVIPSHSSVTKLSAYCCIICKPNSYPHLLGKEWVKRWQWHAYGKGVSLSCALLRKQSFPINVAVYSWMPSRYVLVRILDSEGQRLLMFRRAAWRFKALKALDASTGITASISECSHLVHSMYSCLTAWQMPSAYLEWPCYNCHVGSHSRLSHMKVLFGELRVFSNSSLSLLFIPFSNPK